MTDTSIRTRASKHAFTLLELLIVIAVLTLVASSWLAALTRSSLKTQALQCLNNNRQLCAAWRMYADDSRDQIVYSSDDGQGNSNPLNQYAWTWSHLDFNPQNPGNWNPNLDIPQRPLWPYNKDLSIYKCPSDHSSVVVNGTPMPRIRSMSMNFYLGGFAGTTGGWASAANYRLFLKTTDLTAPGPAKTFVFLDVRWDLINWGNFTTDMAGYPNNPTQYRFNWDLPNMIHDRGCSFSFADGRGEIHRWVDPRTTPPFSLYWQLTDTYPVPRDVDVAWLQDHATRPK